MPFSLALPSAWASQRWKVKIRENERLEPPHTKTWRICLRTGQFLDEQPNPSEVPSALLEVIRGSWDLLRSEWDQKYPENPVDSTEASDD